MNKERSQQLLSEAGESLDYLRDEIRNLALYIAQLEELGEAFRTFAGSARLSTALDRDRRVKLLKDAESVLGPPPEIPSPQNTLPKTPSETDPETWTMLEAFRQAARLR